MVVVQMHGEPGSGKSTLANEIGRALGAVVLDKDVVKSALLRSGIEEAIAAPAAYEAYFAVAGDLVRKGFAIVLDNPVFWPAVERRWLDLVAEAGSPEILIECVCPDRAELERRLATRVALESNPRVPLALDHVPGASATSFQPRLTLDTTRPLDELVPAALDYIHAGVPR